MSTLRKSPFSLISCSTLLLALALLAGRASAQTAVGPVEAAKPEAAAASLPGPTADDAVAMNAKVDSAAADAKPGVTKEQPPPAKEATAPAPPACRNVSADVVALFQPIMLNRMGAAIPNGLIFALKRDLDPSGKMLRPGKRPRPLVLRANVGDCLTVNFWNLVQPPATQPPPPPPATTPTPPPLQFPDTKPVSIHVQGMEWVQGPQDDGSYVGLNNSSLANVTPTAGPPPTKIYTLYARSEGTFLLYTMGDTSTQGDQLVRGLFGAVNIQPRDAEWYRSQVTADELALATYNANSLPAGATLGSCDSSNNCTLTITSGATSKQVKVIKTLGGNLNTPDNHPLVNYDAVYPAGAKGDDGTPIPPGTPILRMLDTGGQPLANGGQIVYGDLTAMITGPGAGRFHGTTGPNNPEPPCNAEKNATLPPAVPDPLFCANPAAPDRKQPYREITIMYHGALGQVAMQAFPVFNDPAMVPTVAAGNDAFAINYGTGGIGAEIYANRLGVGPMGDCVDCKYEEFFLSAWTVGDPAMLVDVPANSNFANMKNQRALVPPCNTTTAFEGNTSANPPGAPNPACANARKPNPSNPGGTAQPYTLAPLPKATKAFFPDDPSND